MSYLGNTPAARFSAMAKQTITGDGGTGYTLDHAVGNEQEIEVFVNNVRQEPGSGKAYTVSGTTLTMTGNVASTDDFYVVYQGKAQQTATHPPTFPLTATTGTFSGDLTVDTSTLKVDSTNNRVGIGSASPLSDLSVESSIGGVLTLSTSDTTGTSGDSLGKIDFYSGDTSNGSTGVQARISGVYDSNGDSTALTFTTGTSTGSGSPTIAERMRITSAGKLCLGTTATFGSSTMLTILPPDSNRMVVTRSFATNTQHHHVFQNNSGTDVGKITVSTSATSYNTSSDYRLKTAVEYDWDATTRLKQLNPVRFNFIADADTTVDGFLAHEVQTVVPEAITGTKDEVDDDGNPVMQGIDQSKLVPLLVKTIQELEARIAALEAS